MSGKLENLVYYTLNDKQAVRTVPPVARQTKGTKKFLHEYWNITGLHERLRSAEKEAVSRKP